MVLLMIQWLTDKKFKVQSSKLGQRNKIKKNIREPVSRPVGSWLSQPQIHSVICKIKF